MNKILFIAIAVILSACTPSTKNFKSVYCFLSSTELTDHDKITFLYLDNPIEDVEKTDFNINQKNIKEFSNNYEYIFLRKKILPDFKKLKSIFPSSVKYIAEGSGFILFKLQKTIQSENFGTVACLKTFNLKDFKLNPKKIKKDEHHSFLHVDTNEVFPLTIKNILSNELPLGNCFTETTITIRGKESGKLFTYVSNFKSDNSISLHYNKHNIVVDKKNTWRTYKFADPIPNYFSKKDVLKFYIWNTPKKSFDIYAITSSLIDDHNGQSRFAGRLQYSKTWHQNHKIASWQKAECFNKENGIRFERVQYKKSGFHHASTVKEMKAEEKDELYIEYSLRNINNNDSSFLNINIKDLSGNIKLKKKIQLNKTNGWQRQLNSISLDLKLDERDILLLYFSNEEKKHYDISNVSFSIIRKNIVCN